MYFCSNCGNQVSDDAIFCVYCGTKKLDYALQEMQVNKGQPVQQQTQLSQAKMIQPQQPVEPQAPVQPTLGVAGGVAPTAAKAGFLSTTLGKAVIIGVAVIATVGIGAGAIHLAKKNIDKKNNETQVTDDKDKSGAVASLGDASKTDASSGDATTSDAEVEEVKELTPELAKDMLRDYLKTTLIPDKEIVEFSQDFYGRYADGYPYISEKVYNQSTNDLESKEIDDLNRFDAEQRDYNYKGLFFADFYDYDQDDFPEMLIAYGTGDGVTSKMEMYDVVDNGVVKTAENTIDFGIVGDGLSDERYIYRTVVDSKPFILMYRYGVHSDVSMNDSYLLYSPADLTKFRTLGVDGIYNQDSPNAEYTVKYKQTGEVQDKGEILLVELENYLAANGFSTLDAQLLCLSKDGIYDKTGNLYMYAFSSEGEVKLEEDKEKQQDKEASKDTSKKDKKNEKNDEATDKESSMKDSDWRSAYTSAVNEFSESHDSIACTYSLAYIDYDDIPELLCTVSEDEYSSMTYVYTFIAGKAVLLDGGFSGPSGVGGNNSDAYYFPQMNYITKSYNSEMGANLETGIYRMNDKKTAFTEKWVSMKVYDSTKYSGVYEAVEAGESTDSWDYYFIDDVKVTEEEYYNECPDFGGFESIALVGEKTFAEILEELK